MKKLLTSFAAVALAVTTLVGCNAPVASTSSEEATNEAPVITGVQDTVSITLGETWNPLEGVTASDKEDGDVTEDITIESIPVMVLAEAGFTPEEQGEYYITYNVKDSKGLESSEFTTLNVTKAISQETVYKNYEFVDSGVVDLAGWEAAFNEGAAGSLQAEKGKLVFAVTALGTSDGHAQLTKKLVSAVAGTEYELKVTMSASVAGKFHFIINNTLAGWAPLADAYNLEVTTTPQTYSLKYSVADNNDAIEYLINVGGPLNTGAMEFFIDKIELVSSVGTETEQELASETFDLAEDVNEWGLSQDESASSSIAVADSKLVYTINNYATEGQAWNMNLYYITGFNIVKDKKYKLTMDVTVINDQFFELCFEDVSLDWQIRAGFKNGTLSGTSTLEHTFYAGQDITGLYIKLALGKGTTSNVISFDNVRFVELVGDKEVTSEVTTFMASTEEAEWDTFNDNGGVGSIYTENGKLYYNITQFGSSDWYNKFFIKKINLEAGALYKVEFKIKADKNLKGFFAFNVFGKWDPRITAEFNITTEETTISYTTDAELVIAMDFEILFQFGGYPENVGPALIEFSDITIYQLK